MFCLAGCSKDGIAQKDYNNNLHCYTIVSIYPYQHIETNNFGGIIHQGIWYNVIYMDENSNTYTNEYYDGDIQIGENDIIYVNNNTNPPQYQVYLTKETASKLSLQNNN